MALPNVNSSLAAGASADDGKPVSAKSSLAGGVIAGIGASICCVGPLVLVALGLGGAAAGLIAFFTPLRPIFIGLALVFLGFAAYRLFSCPRCAHREWPALSQGRCVISDCYSSARYS